MHARAARAYLHVLHVARALHALTRGDTVPTPPPPRRARSRPQPRPQPPTAPVRTTPEPDWEPWPPPPDAPPPLGPDCVPALDRAQDEAQARWSPDPEPLVLPEVPNTADLPAASVSPPRGFGAPQPGRAEIARQRRQEQAARTARLALAWDEGHAAGSGAVNPYRVVPVHPARAVLPESESESGLRLVRHEPDGPDPAGS